MEPGVGFEPTTCCLQNSCSNQLSYPGLVGREGFEPPKAQGQLIYSQPRLSTSLSAHVAGAVGIEPTTGVLETPIIPFNYAPIRATLFALAYLRLFM